MKELFQLESAGLIASSGEVFTAPLAIVVGDILGQADLSYRSGHTSYTGCRMYDMRGTRPSNTICFPTYQDNTIIKNKMKLRTIADYREAKMPTQPERKGGRIGMEFNGLKKVSPLAL